MEVYIEDVVFDNFIIDSIILLLTAKILKNKYKIIFILFSAILGVIFNVIFLFLNFSNFFSFFYKIILSVLMVLIAFGVKRFFLNYITFLFTTFLIGGACYAISMTFGDVEIINGSVFYNMAIPMWLVAIVVCLIAYFVNHLINFIKENCAISDFVYQVEITYKQKIHTFKAYLDTGNTLTENGQPVMFITFKAFSKIFGLNMLDVLSHKFDLLNNPHYKEIDGIGNKSKILLFNLENVKIIKKNKKIIIKNAIFGLSFANLEKKLNCSILLNSGLIGGELWINY